MCGEFGEVTVIIGLVINLLAFVSPLLSFRDTLSYIRNFLKISISILSDNGTFDDHIEKACKKARQKSGRLFRRFYSRNTLFLRQMFKSLVQPHLDCCSQLWSPLEGPKLEKIEKVLKDFTKRIPELQSMNYWQRLQKMNMSCEQRRMER